MKYDNQLRYAVNVIKDYDGRHPLSAWLKDFFRENRQMGSRDRKTVSALVYSYFRLGHNDFASIEKRMLAALFACKQLPELADYFSSSRESPDTVSIDKIFPWSDGLSAGIDPHVFASSFLVQPDLYLRIRPGRKQGVMEKLDRLGISYSTCDEHCIALDNATKIDSVLDINREVVVQDKSSQRTGLLLNGLACRTVWDCCAASGGKAIMAADFFGTIDITATDIRESIIRNLKERFEEAGIRQYRAFVADLTSSDAALPEEKFDLVIADVPCSGSGTWARTPEQLLFFRPQKIAQYSAVQKRIADCALSRVHAGGHLLYITCSVFRQENEEAAENILSHPGVQLVKQELIKGYLEKADTMFAALFTIGPA